MDKLGHVFDRLNLNLMNHPLDFLRQQIYNELELLVRKNAMVDWMTDLCNVENEEKDIQQSQRAKAEGDKLFAEDNLEVEHQHKIIRSYNESIAYAPLGSEDLAKCYANKSALLRRMRRYSECISEADKALKISQSIPMKIKLLCRKAECHTALGSLDNRSCLEKAKFLMTRSEISQEPEKMKKMLKKLVEKTEAIVDENKLQIPKEAKRYAQAPKLIADIQGKDVWQHSVKVDYSEKYGLHLVAARNFEPGENIISEKPYHYHLQYDGIYQYCYHCLNYLWTVVPCDHCSWRGYCSDECKNDSWNKYHDMECAVASMLRKRLGSEGGSGLFILSIFFKTLKEAGSISQLLADIDSTEQEGQCLDDFVSDGGFNYKNIYTMPVSVSLTKEKLKDYAESAIGMLVGIGVFTKIFGNTHYFCSKGVLAKLKDDKTAISVGALLMRLNIVVTNGPANFQLMDPTNLNSTFTELGCAPPGSRSSQSLSLNSSTLMAIVGCMPNVVITPTRDHLYLWHSLQPIKKGDKLVSYDMASSIYNYIPGSIRQSMFKRRYRGSCDCRACTENWSMEYFRKGMYEAKVEDDGVIRQLISECNHWITERKGFSRKYLNPDMKAMSKVKDLLVRSWKICEMPSTIILRAVRIYTDVVGLFHGQSRCGW